MKLDSISASPSVVEISLNNGNSPHFPGFESDTLVFQAGQTQRCLELAVSFLYQSATYRFALSEYENVLCTSGTELIVSGCNTLDGAQPLLPPFPGQTPAPGTRAFAGVDLTSQGLLIIGTAGGQPNTFSALRNGIITTNTSTVIENTIFEDILLSNTEPNYPFTGFAVRHSGGAAHALALRGLGMNPAAPATFDNCTNGVWATGTDVSVQQARMTDMTNGVTIRLATDRDIELKHNRISAAATGIYLEHNDPAQQIDVSDFASDWYWELGDGSTSTARHPVHVYAQGGLYTVCLTASNFTGSHTVCDTVRVEVVSSVGFDSAGFGSAGFGSAGFGSAQPAAGVRVEIWPNPVPATLVAEGIPAGHRGLSVVEIHDALGRLALRFTAPVVNGRIRQELDVRGLAAGVYFYELRTHDGLRIGSGKLVWM